MWQGRRRLGRLERELAEVRAAHAALRQRMELFEQIAAAAGAGLGEPAGPASTAARGTPPAVAAGGPVTPVPAALLAAATVARHQGAPVRLSVGGQEVIAVVGDEGGDASAWWSAISRLASRLRSAS